MYTGFSDLWKVYLELLITKTGFSDLWQVYLVSLISYFEYFPNKICFQTVSFTTWWKMAVKPWQKNIVAKDGKFGGVFDFFNFIQL